MGYRALAVLLLAFAGTAPQPALAGKDNCGGMWQEFAQRFGFGAKKETEAETPRAGISPELQKALKTGDFSHPSARYVSAILGGQRQVMRIDGRAANGLLDVTLYNLSREPFRARIHPDQLAQPRFSMKSRLSFERPSGSPSVNDFRDAYVKNFPTPESRYVSVVVRGGTAERPTMLRLPARVIGKKGDGLEVELLKNMRGRTLVDRMEVTGDDLLEVRSSANSRAEFKKFDDWAGAHPGEADYRRAQDGDGGAREHATEPPPSFHKEGFPPDLEHAINSGDFSRPENQYLSADLGGERRALRVIRRLPQGTLEVELIGSNGHAYRTVVEPTSLEGPRYSLNSRLAFERYSDAPEINQFRDAYTHGFDTPESRHISILEWLNEKHTSTSTRTPARVLSKDGNALIVEVLRDRGRGNLRAEKLRIEGDDLLNIRTSATAQREFANYDLWHAPHGDSATSRADARDRVDEALRRNREAQERAQTFKRQQDEAAERERQRKAAEEAARQKAEREAESQRRYEKLREQFRREQAAKKSEDPAVKAKAMIDEDYRKLSTEATESLFNAKRWLDWEKIRVQNKGVAQGKEPEPSASDACAGIKSLYRKIIIKYHEDTIKQSHPDLVGVIDRRFFSQLDSTKKNTIEQIRSYARGLGFETVPNCN